MSEAVFDTNVIVDHLRNVAKATALMEKVREGSITAYISTITVAEIFAGKDASDPAKKTLFDKLLEIFSKIDVSEGIAKTAGDFRRECGISTVDAIIGATAASLGCILLTQNIRDFARVKAIASKKPY